MLYIHIPFCKGKCIYCDFYSSGNPDWGKYLKAITSELSIRVDELRGDFLSSVYIGGGTPSLMPADVFSPFMESVWQVLNDAGIRCSESPEITVEVNPEDVDISRVRAWKGAGINRVSMGVQSLDDDELRLLRRRHDSASVYRAFDLVGSHFGNVSLDVIYGIPGQTVESYRETLREIVALKPNHVSAYSLTYEPKTPLVVLRDSGRLRECNEEEYLKMDSLTAAILQEAGYERYEISNYCLPGFHSRHNSGYWSGKPYLGLGPSACSFDGKNVRRSNPADLKGYMMKYGAGESSPEPFYVEETLGIEECRIERIFTSLRRKSGLSLSDFERDFGSKERATLEAGAQKWVDSGDMVCGDETLALSGKGINISDHIILDLI